MFKLFLLGMGKSVARVLDIQDIGPRRGAAGPAIAILEDCCDILNLSDILYNIQWQFEIRDE
jgi:hypothetical protein